MKVIANLHICIGAGQCVANAPHIFSQDDDTGLVVAPLDDILDAEREDLEMAVYSCPTRALSISE